MVCGSWKNWLSFGTARHSIIKFNKSFFAHESELDPIFTCWGLYWNSILLRINSLPDRFVRFNISDASISNELELRSDPFCVFRHLEAHVKISIDWNLNRLWLISRISYCFTFSLWRCFTFFSSFVSSSGFFSSFLSFGNFLFIF
jgi:hypothetical protein